MKFSENLKEKLKFKKTKLLKQERKLKKNKAGTIVTAGFYVVLVTIFFLAFQSYTRTGFINQKLNGFQSEAQAQIKGINQSAFVSSPAGEDYAERFVKDYIAIPADKEGREQRAEKLQNYFAEGLSMDRVENLADFKGKRVLKDIKLYKIENVKAESAELLFRISYEVINIKEIKKVEKKGKTKREVTEQQEQQPIKKEMLIAVPLGTNGETFNVIEQPYFESIPTGSKLAAVKDQGTKTKQDFKRTEEIKVFTAQFLTSYTENTKEEMAYLMEKPDSLKGLYQYKGLQEITVYKAGKGKWEVKALVELKEQESGLVVKQPMTLILSKQNEKYFVEKLKQTLGGN